MLGLLDKLPYNKILFFLRSSSFGNRTKIRVYLRQSNYLRWPMFGVSFMSALKGCQPRKSLKITSELFVYKLNKLKSILFLFPTFCLLKFCEKKNTFVCPGRSTERESIYLLNNFAIETTLFPTECAFCFH